MDEVHGQHRQEHGYAIEEVQENLVGKDVSFESLQVFDNSNNGPHKNKHADNIQTVHVSPPRNVVTPGCGISSQALVEYSGRDNEKTEEDDLYELESTLLV